MQSDIDTIINDLLTRWHQWARPFSVERGYPSQSPTCRQHRASRQYDDGNGAMDSDIEDTIMEAFDAAINRVQQPHLNALQILARNMAVGHFVWSSPRLPVDPMERGVLLLEARTKLMKELAGDGILG